MTPPACKPSRPSRLARRARLMLPAAALAVVLGGSAALASPAYASPSPAAAAKPPVFRWHDFTLLNGWKTAGTKKLVTGHPGWSLSNGVVYLRGAVKETKTSQAEKFATLPKYARPAQNLYIQVWTTGNVPGTVFIGSNGVLDAYNGNADTFASLAAISFPTATIKPTKLKLTSGWKSSRSQYGTGDPSYSISHGIVYLSGSVFAGTAGDAAFQLPKAARPAHQAYVSVYTFAGSSGTLVFTASGKVEVFGSESGSFTSLANISYPAPGAKWHNFKLASGWKSAQAAFDTGAPAYTVIGGVRYLGGSMMAKPSSTGLWTVLPAATRTADVLEIEVYTDDGTTGGVAVTNSLGLASSDPFSNAQLFTSLAAIAYPPGT